MLAGNLSPIRNQNWNQKEIWFSEWKRPAMHVILFLHVHARHSMFPKIPPLLILPQSALWRRAKKHRLVGAYWISRKAIWQSKMVLLSLKVYQGFQNGRLWRTRNWTLKTPVCIFLSRYRSCWFHEFIDEHLQKIHEYFLIKWSLLLLFPCAVYMG